AGASEVVPSGSRRSTQDVGVTFPSPGCGQQLQGPWQLPGQALGAAAGAAQGAQAARLPLGRRSRRSRLHLQQAGTPWLVQAEDSKSEWRKENQGSAIPGPGPSWFEPWSSCRPWREPLREKNWAGQQHSGGQGAAAH
ncbi:ALMS1 protein, partial [Climacteris rufus]|nr:ALMS1 protein [Climacteris rufus]